MMGIKDDVIGDVGEVEVRAHIIRTVLGKPVLGFGPCESGENLVNIDHVNRLASNRDELLAEVAQECRRIENLSAIITELQSELTKAREALKYIEDNSDDEVACLVAYEAGTKRLLYTK